MAVSLKPERSTVLEAQQRIFNKLCIAYRHSGQRPDFRVRAEDVRNELALPQRIFVEAMDNFIDARGVEIILQQDGNKFITLGETARSNISDQDITSKKPTDDDRPRRPNAVIATRR